MTGKYYMLQEDVDKGTPVENDGDAEEGQSENDGTAGEGQSGSDGIAGSGPGESETERDDE
jgi:hypothetical protein